MSEPQGRRVALAAINAAEATQLASLRAALVFNQALVSSPLLAARFITQATLFAFGLVEQTPLAGQPNDTLVKPPRNATPGAPNASLVTTIDDAVQTAARKTIDDAPPAFVMGLDDAAPALATGLDDAAPALVTTADYAALVGTADDAPPAPVATTGQDQEIELRAERLVVDKQRVQNGKARVRKEILTEVKSIDVPVSHEELVIDRQAVTDDVDVEGGPIGDETIRIPLTEEQVDITKKTVVREEVEIGKRRVEDVEHISDTVRHEELRVDDAPTNHDYEPTAF